jgi:DNA-binding LytR/AlgR family response regulator
MSITILTIEDNLIIAEDLEQKLIQLGYRVLGNATSSDEALQLIGRVTPDLIIADIIIDGDKDGIETISEIQKRLMCPVIYLTANSESAMVKRALATHPAAFLIKPFKISEFAINIDLAIRNFRKQITFQSANVRVTDSIFLPQDFLYHRVRKKDIYYVEADGAYVKVFTKEKRYHVTVNLKSFERQLSDRHFLRISRKHLINTEYISRINGILYT